MTFDLVRVGWPNTVAILALALMPLISLTLPAGPAPETLMAKSIGSGAQTAMLVEPQPDRQ